MLNNYLSQVRTLLHDPTGQFFTDATLTGFINQARQQIALEGKCIRGIGTISTVAAQQAYLTTFVAPPSVPTGIAALLVPRMIRFDNGFGQVTLETREWEWFNFYQLGFLNPPPGQPQCWSAFVVGNDPANNTTVGSFYISPAPDAAYVLDIDGAWSPADLALDGDPEAIPYPWTDAVQYYGAYLAFLDAQRERDAAQMFKIFEGFMERAASARGLPVGIGQQILAAEPAAPTAGVRGG